MTGKGLLTRQEQECFEIFQWYNLECHDLILKQNIKKWEYDLYGGRPEFYPQDRRALLAMIQIFNEKATQDNQHSQRKMEAQQRMREKRKAMLGL